MGVITGVKNRYKFLLLKYLPKFYQVDNDKQQSLKEEGSKFCRGSFGFRYVRPPTMLKTNGTKLRLKIKKKSFHRVRRISLYSAITETFDNNEFLKLFRNFNIVATGQDINKFVATDDESSQCSKKRY